MTVLYQFTIWAFTIYHLTIDGGVGVFGEEGFDGVVFLIEVEVKGHFVFVDLERSEEKI